MWGRVGIQRRIDTGFLRKLLVVAAYSINEQLPIAVLAVHVEEEISVSGKEYAPQGVRTMERAFESLSSRKRQIRFVCNLKLFKTTLLVADECNSFFRKYGSLVIENREREEWRFHKIGQ